jgi:hypothetical protein
MLTLILAYIAMSMNANAQVRFAPVEGQYEIKADYQYLTTSANYPIGGGTSNSLFGGGSYTRMLGTGEVTYDFTPAIRFWGGFSGGQATANVVNVSQSITSTVTQTNTNSGVNEGYLGAQWWTEYQALDIVPQVDFVFPFWRPNDQSSTPMLGEGALRFQAGTWVMLPLKDFTPFVYGGLAYQDGGRTSLFPYSVGARYGKANGWWIQGEFRGSVAFNNDAGSDPNSRAVRDALLSRTDGGSDQFYAINSSSHEVAAMAGFHYESFGIFGGASKTVFGQSAADDWTVTVGATFNGSLFPKKKNAGAGFTEKKETYDKNLFKGPVTPEEDPEQILMEKPAGAKPPPTATPAPVDTTAPAPGLAPGQTPVPKPKRKKPKKEEPMPNVELLMKDTEKSLQK